MASLQDRMRLNQAARNLERDLHSARNKAVANNRAMRVVFNCPAAGQYRVVELLGSVSAPAAADSGASRCLETNYPYPPPDNDFSTRPNFDGQVRQLDPSVQFGAVQTIEFWTDGSAHAGAASPFPMLSVAGTSLTLTKTAGSTTRTATITVNGIGKIKLQPVQ
jgi:Type II transport protein GspH